MITAAVSSSMPMPSRLGDWATHMSSRPYRLRWVKCWSMTQPSTRPSPEASWVIRCLGVAPPLPNATMCDDWKLAPADVPPIVTPRAWASLIASPNGVPLMIAESFSWLPPVMKMPVTSSSRSTYDGSEACSRLSGRAPNTSAAPSRVNSATYTSMISGPRLEAVGTTAIRASSPPHAATNLVSTVRFWSLSSAPPMT